MGFDINFSNKPIIKGAQSAQDGGAGNLGYFKGQNKDEKEACEKSVFGEKEDVDTFEKKEDLQLNESDFSISNMIAKIISAIKNFFKKFFQN